MKILAFASLFGALLLMLAYPVMGQIFYTCTPVPNSSLYQNCQTITSVVATRTTVPRQTVTLTPFPSPLAYITQIDPRRTQETPFNTPTQEFLEQPSVITYRVIVSILNVRPEAATSQPAIFTLRAGYQVETTGQPIPKGGYQWVRVVAYWDGKTLVKELPKWIDLAGWVALGAGNQIYLTKV